MSRVIPVNKHSGKVFEVSGFSNANGAPIQQWDWHGGANQRFNVEFAGADTFNTYYRVVATNRKVLDVFNSLSRNGAPIQQWDLTGGDNQEFRVNRHNYYCVFTTFSDRVLEVPGSSLDNGVQIQQWDWRGGDNQQWLLTLNNVDPDGSTVIVIAKHSRKVLDVFNSLTRSGAPIQQWDYHGGANQLFRLELVEQAFFNLRYRLVAVNSGKVLEVPGSSLDNGVQIQQGDWRGGDNQMFTIERAGGMYYRLVALHSGKVLDVSGSSDANGARLLQWDRHGGDNQQWLFSPASCV